MAFSPVCNGFSDRLTINHAGSDFLNRIIFVGQDRSAIVDRITQRIDDATDQRLAYRNLHDAAGAFDQVAFLDLLKIAEQHDADLVFFQVEREPAHVVRKLEQLAGHDSFQTVNFGDAVADLDHGADFRDRDAGLKVLDLLPDDFVDFVCFDWFHDSFPIVRLPIANCDF